jgi:hypothetical protein
MTVPLTSQTTTESATDAVVRERITKGSCFT